MAERREECELVARWMGYRLFYSDAVQGWYLELSGGGNTGINLVNPNPTDVLSDALPLFDDTPEGAEAREAVEERLLREGWYVQIASIHVLDPNLFFVTMCKRMDVLRADGEGATLSEAKADALYKAVRALEETNA